MYTIISKRHPLGFYGVLIFGLLFFMAMGTFFLLLSIKKHGGGEWSSKDYLLPAFAFVLYFMAFYTAYIYIKYAPNIRINKESITVNKRVYAFADLTQMELTGKRNLPYLLSYPMEAATLVFNNGTTLILFDNFYQNDWEMKSFMQQVIVDKKEYTPEDIAEIPVSDGDTEYFETYSGIQITSFRGILLWCSLLFMSSLILFKGKSPLSLPDRILFIGCFEIFILFMLSLQMNYFKISPHFLLVRNQNLFWKYKMYRLTDIDEIVYETAGKMPNCLRVIQKDFRYKIYPASSLRDRTWLEMKDKLESLGVKVRNECI